MSINHFFINSDVLTEQHRLQTRIRTGKCNLFNLIPKLLSTNIGYDSTVRYQTKQMHLLLYSTCVKISFTFNKRVELFKLDNPLLHLRQELRDTFH